MERIRIGVAHRGAGLAPVFAALHCGALGRAGLVPELVFLPGHPATLDALLDGAVDVINTVGPELLLANHRRGGDAVVVASAISRTGVQVSARPGLADRAALRGRRWGCLARGDADECSMSVACEAWGWDMARDITVVAIGDGPRLPRLLDTARVDVAIMHAPEAFLAERAGWQVVEDLARLDIAYQNSCAATTRRALSASPGLVRRYVRAYAEGVWRFRSDAAFGMEVLRQQLETPDEELVRRTWTFFARLMGGMLFPSIDGMRRAGAALQAIGALPSAPDIERCITLAPVAELESGGAFAELMGAVRQPG